MIGGYYGILMKLMVFNQTVWFFFKADLQLSVMLVEIYLVFSMGFTADTADL